MALSVRNVGKFANSTCVLLSRTAFIDRENTLNPLLKPHFQQVICYLLKRYMYDTQKLY